MVLNGKWTDSVSWCFSTLQSGKNPELTQVWLYYGNHCVLTVIRSACAHSSLCHIQIQVKSLSCKEKATCEPQMPSYVEKRLFQMGWSKLENCSMVTWMHEHGCHVLWTKEEMLVISAHFSYGAGWISEGLGILQARHQFFKIHTTKQQTLTRGHISKSVLNQIWLGCLELRR